MPSKFKTLVAAKYGFTDNKYITFIKNQECTRARILAELNKLIDQSEKGDIVLFIMPVMVLKFIIA